MKIYDFDTPINRKNTQCIKWDQSFESTVDTQYPLWVADMDFSCCDAIVEALKKRVEQQIYGYNTGFDAQYRQVVCDWFARRFDWKINPSDIFYAGGVVPAIAYLIEILSVEGDGIVIQTPVYYPFRKKIEATKRKVVENPLQNENGYYTMNFEELDHLLGRDDVKGMILCSPHNPIGRVWKQEELSMVLKLIKKHRKWIISDEIHGDLIRHHHRQLPLAKLGADMCDQIITCTAPSKSFNLAGLQNINIIISNKEYQQRWKKYVLQRLSLSGPNSFALSATMAAYTQGEEWLNQLNAYLDTTIVEVTSYLKKQLPKAIVSPCEGTYLLWVDVRGYCKDQERLEKAMLQAGLILDEGYLFGIAGSGFERINVACPRAFLMEAMERFVAVVKSLDIDSNKRNRYDYGVC